MSVRFELVETSEALAPVVDRIAKSDIIAFDLEGEFNLHRYGMHLCLMQFSDGKKTYLVDPLSIKDIRPLLDLLGDPAVMKISHGPQSDLVLIDKLYRRRARNIFDTEKAAQLLAYNKTSLSALLEKHFGMEKNVKIREKNWTKRPLSDKMLEYAAMDVAYLIKLHKILTKDLEKVGRLDWQAEENKLLESVRYVPKKYPYFSLKGASKLRKPARKILHCLYDLRERIAEELDKPPAYVIRNDLLVDLAQHPPRGEKGWAALKGVHPKLKKYSEELVAAVKEGRTTEDENIGAVPTYDDQDISRFPKNRKKYDRIRKELEAIQKDIQTNFDVAPMIISNKTIHRLACGTPTDFLKRWQLKIIKEVAKNMGKDLNSILAGKPNN